MGPVRDLLGEWLRGAWGFLSRHWLAVLLPPAIFLLAAGVTRQVLRAWEGAEAEQWRDSYRAAAEAGMAGDQEQALEHLRVAASAVPDDPRAQVQLADGFANLGRRGRALEHIERAVRMRKEPDPEAYVGLVRAYADQGQFREAERLLEKEIFPRWPDSADAHYYQGLIAAQKGEGEASLRQALSSYDRALELDPDHADALYRSGVARSRLGQLDEAEEALRRVLEINPRFPPAHHELAKVLRRRGELDEAKRLLAEFQELDRRRRRIERLETQISLERHETADLLELGELYLEADRPEAAIRPLERYTKLAPIDPRGHRRLAEAYLGAERPEDAEPERKLAEALDSAEPAGDEGGG